MGTNYYARFNCCEKCERPEKEVHIGKKSFGWQFHFYGEKPNLTTKKQWEEIIYKQEVRIYDEYGDWITISEFFDMVRDSLNPENLSHYRVMNNVPLTNREKEYLRDHPDTGYNFDSDETWIDPEGFTFTQREFC